MKSHFLACDPARQRRMARGQRVFTILIGALSLFPIVAHAAGDAEAGARAFRVCVACHSLSPDQNMTGPSLAHSWGRKAGSASGFDRYSPALKSSGIVWDEKTLDAWLANPRALVPGNWMGFAGIKDPRIRADLIAFLQSVASGSDRSGETGDMRMNRQPQREDLKKIGRANRVTAIRYCRDTYWVTTAAGALPPYWEFNLRFKTDSSATGPAKGRPAIMGAGMTGDRASVIFADPSEISGFIEKKC